MRIRLRKWFVSFLIVILSFIILLVILQFILNSRIVQNSGLKTVSNLFHIELKWDKLRFNGFTGHFEGTNLDLFLPKSKTKITIPQFEIALDPLRLFIRKIHLYDLQAKNITVEITPVPKENKKKKERKIDLERILTGVSLDRGDLTDITVLIDDKQISVRHLAVRSHLSFLIINRGLSVTLEGIKYLSPKFDLFTDRLHLEGNFSINQNALNNQNNFEWDGQIRINSSLFGFYKTPSPWNPEPAWDDSLNPLIQQKYPEGIPDNRVYAFLNNATFSVAVSPQQIKVNSASIKAFDGGLSLNGEWNFNNQNAHLSVGTDNPIKIDLLPLGKAKIRKSFEELKLNLSIKGKIKNLFQGKANGELNLTLQGNQANPEVESLNLLTPLQFQNGILQFPQINIKLGEGILTGNGHIDLTQKRVDSLLNGKNIDAQTVVRFFSGIDIPGKADLSGGITGALNNPTFNFSLSSPAASYENLNFGTFTGNLLIKDKNLSLTGTTLLDNTGAGKLELKIKSVFKSSTQVIDLKTEFNSLPLGPLLDSKAIQGVATGAVMLHQEQKKMTGKGNITITDITWFKLPIASLQGDLTIDDKTLTIQPIQLGFNPDETPITFSKPLVFYFSREGFRFEGLVFPNVTIEGEKNNLAPDEILFKIKAESTDLDFLAPILPLGVDHFLLSGLFDGIYRPSSPKDSVVHAELSTFEFKGEEKNIRLVQKTKLDYQGQRILFNRTRIQLDQEEITLEGPLGLTGDSALRIRGNLDLNQAPGLIPGLVEGEGRAELDLILKGSLFKPAFDGKVDFKNASFFIPALRGELTSMNGVVRMASSRFHFDNFSAEYEDASITLSGWIEWTAPQVTAADITLTGKEIPFSSPDTWQIYSDANVSLRGSSGNLKLSGLLQVVEGIYYKDYTLTNFVLRPIGVARSRIDQKSLALFKDIQLNLQVRSSGEFEIRNNLTDLVLKGNLGVGGTFGNPALSGSIDVIEGEIHAFGIDFENASGFASFIDPKKNIPYIEFTAAHTIQQYEVKAKLNGYSDNLALTLESTPTLNQTDIFALIAYGRTPDELATDRQNLFSTLAIAGQVVGMLQRPLSKATNLDIIKLESDPTGTGSTLSRFSIGKQISDRFSLAFTTDLSFDEAQQGVVVEYLLLDNLLLKGIKDTGSRYRFDLTLRLEGY